MVGLLFITVYPYLRRYIYIVWPVGLYARFVPAFSKRVLALARGLLLLFVQTKTPARKRDARNYSPSLRNLL